MTEDTQLCLGARGGLTGTVNPAGDTWAHGERGALRGGGGCLWAAGLGQPRLKC